jgi:gliding motility-associated-like protein
LKRKLLILTGCIFLLGIGVYGQAPVANFTANTVAGCAPLIVTFKDLSTNSPTAWEWDFGNGTTSSSQNPSSNYYFAGTYTVTLIVKNASGANAIRQTNYITVYPTPTAKFGENLTTACAPATIQFTDFSVPGGSPIVSWVWAFGDGSGSNLMSPSHVYTQTGYYDVSLTVTNAGGCSNTVTYPRTIRIINGIQPNFTWNQTGSSCLAPYTLDFVNQTAGPGNLNYNWTLGTGATPATSTSANPANISYPSAGNYSVTLAVQSDLGCSQTITQTVPLSSGAAVINGPTSGCLNTAISFSNGTNPAPLSSFWDFGDGTNSNQFAPTKTYTTPGTYPVTLTNTFATCNSTTTQNITIGATFVPVFTATPATGCKTPLSVQFTDQTSPANTQWLWDFNDGTTFTGLNPLHTYTTSGIFNVKLTATNSTGCIGTATQTAAVTITAPTVNITASSGCVNLPMVPAYTVNAPDGVALYSWSAPGASPSTSNAANPSFIYPAAGSYSLTLTITTNGGCTATQTLSNIVQIGTPTVASFTPSVNPACGSNPVTFTSTGTPADHWLWSFGDGTIDSGAIVSHLFKKFGNLIVTLSIDNNGCTTQATNTEVVSPPIPNFGYVVNCTAINPLINNNLSVSFPDSTLHDVNPLTYYWDYGDGTNSGLITAPPFNPAHIYPAVPGYGPYTVTLTVTDNGCSATVQKTIVLVSITPSFNILVNNIVATQVCEDAPFTLSSTSTTVPFGTPNGGYIWQIGAMPPTPQSHAYTRTVHAIGTYPVMLTVKDINGCQYTSPSTSLVVKGPTAAFTAPTGNCINSAVTFTDNTILDPPGDTLINWGWSFGDGTPARRFTTPPFTHTYTDTGTFVVTVVVEDGTGCVSNSLADTIQITAPRALFGPPDSFYCPNTPLTFIDSSQGYGLTENWTFGDGATSGPVPSPPYIPTHPYAASTTPYQVTLSVTDKYGCTNTETKSVLIQPPVAAFTIADTTSICFPAETLFTAAGQYYDSLIWKFGDGQSSTLDTTAHFYNTYDTFSAKLVVTGPGGCQDSTTRRVLVLDPKKTTTFTFTPETACDSIFAKFTIVPPGYTTFQLAFGDKQGDSSGNTAPIHTYRLPGSYIPVLTLTDATGCIVPLQDTILTVLGAVPFFTVTPPAFCDSSIVSFTDYTISNDGILSKIYDFGDGSPLLPQPPPLTNSFDTTHYYNTPGMLRAILNVVTNHNCTASYIDTIRVYQTPHPVIATIGFLCAGLVQFQGTLNPPDADTISWLWNFGGGQTAGVQNPLVTIQAGTYLVSLKASVSFGCSDTTSTTISINPDPVIKGPAVITTPVGVPITIPFTYSSGITTYSWTPTSNLDCSNCANPSATLTLAQEYTVLVTDSNNCTDTASILIKTICNEGSYFLPNTFSPNGDGVNDYFYPRGKGVYNIQSMSIFNRWGQLVFQRQNFPPNSETMGWDGNFNGHPAPSDAYVYIVEVICNNAQIVALHGNVTLVR